MSIVMALSLLNSIQFGAHAAPPARRDRARRPPRGCRRAGTPAGPGRGPRRAARRGGRRRGGRRTSCPGRRRAAAPTISSLKRCAGQTRSSPPALTSTSPAISSTGIAVRREVGAGGQAGLVDGPGIGEVAAGGLVDVRHAHDALTAPGPLGVVDRTIAVVEVRASARPPRSGRARRPARPAGPRRPSSRAASAPKEVPSTPMRGATDASRSRWGSSASSGTRRGVSGSPGAPNHGTARAAIPCAGQHPGPLLLDPAGRPAEDQQGERRRTGCRQHG